MDQRVEPLTPDLADQVEEQRSWVRNHYDDSAKARYETIEGKIHLIETILQAGWIAPDETWKLQSLGITFGDALAQKLELQWVAVEDEYGRDPALQLGGTSILLFRLTAISKRIERGESVDVRQLFV